VGGVGGGGDKCKVREGRGNDGGGNGWWAVSMVRSPAAKVAKWGSWRDGRLRLGMGGKGAGDSKIPGGLGGRRGLVRKKTMRLYL